jgi:hypothetical protein
LHRDDAKRGSGNAAGVVEDGETEIVLLLEFTVAIGNGLVGARDERGTSSPKAR